MLDLDFHTLVLPLPQAALGAQISFSWREYDSLMQLHHRTTSVTTAQRFSLSPVPPLPATAAASSQRYSLPSSGLLSTLPNSVAQRSLHLAHVPVLADTSRHLVHMPLLRRHCRQNACWWGFVRCPGAHALRMDLSRRRIVPILHLAHCLSSLHGTMSIVNDTYRIELVAESRSRPL